MADVVNAIETQLRNIETRTGKSLEELSTLIRDSERTTHQNPRRSGTQYEKHRHNQPSRRSPARRHVPV